MKSGRKTQVCCRLHHHKRSPITFHFFQFSQYGNVRWIICTVNYAEANYGCAISRLLIQTASANTHFTSSRTLDEPDSKSRAFQYCTNASLKSEFCFQIFSLPIRTFSSWSQGGARCFVAFCLIFQVVFNSRLVDNNETSITWTNINFFIKIHIRRGVARDSHEGGTKRFVPWEIAFRELFAVVNQTSHDVFYEHLENCWFRIGEWLTNNERVKNKIWWHSSRFEAAPAHCVCCLVVRRSTPPRIEISALGLWI